MSWLILWDKAAFNLGWVKGQALPGFCRRLLGQSCFHLPGVLLHRFHQLHLLLLQQLEACRFLFRDLPQPLLHRVCPSEHLVCLFCSCPKQKDGELASLPAEARLHSQPGREPAARDAFRDEPSRNELSSFVIQQIFNLFVILLVLLFQI